MRTMDDFGMRNAINRPLKAVRITGHWPTDGKYTLISVNSLYIFLFYVICSSHVLFQIINYYYIYNQIELLASSLYLVIEEALALVKGLFFMYNVHHLKYAYDALEDDLFQPKTSKQNEECSALMKTWMNIYYVYGGTSFICVILWIVMPLVKGGGEFPFISWFPYDPKPFPAYQLTYLHQAFGVALIAFNNWNLDSLLWYLMMFISMQCKILCENLRNLNVRADEQMKNVSTFCPAPEALHKAFLECIAHHKKILIFVQHSHTFSKGMTSAQLVTTVLALCMTMIRLSTVKPSSSEFPYLISYQTAVLQQILMYCWFGNSVIIESSKIPYAVFESPWYKYGDTKLWKDMKFFVRKTQRPIILKSFNNVIALSLETFVKILRSSWSYFALLNSLRSE